MRDKRPTAQKRVQTRTKLRIFILRNARVVASRSETSRGKAGCIAAGNVRKTTRELTKSVQFAERNIELILNNLKRGLINIAHKFVITKHIGQPKSVRFVEKSLQD